MTSTEMTTPQAGPLDAWPLHGYAPGNYSCKCHECTKEFIGDKRAYTCLECAVLRSKRAALPVNEGDLFEAIRTIIYKRISSQVDTHFIDRIHLVGVPDAAAEIVKLVLSDRAALPVPAGAVTDEMAEASFRCIRRVVIDNDTNLRRLARQSLEAALASRPAVEATADWRDDPSSDERWNAGLDFAMLQLCAALGVDADSISFDAATETLDGDVQSVMWRILQARFGEDFPAPSPSTAGDEVQGMDALTAALVVLARYNVPPDVQELLVQGNPMRDIRPGALAAALTQLSEQIAALRVSLEEMHTLATSHAARADKAEGIAEACESTYAAWRDRACKAEAEVERWQSNWDANVQEMSEKFRAVNIAKVIEATGHDEGGCLNLGVPTALLAQLSEQNAALTARAEKAERERAEWEAAKRELQADQYEHPWTVNKAAQERIAHEASRALLAEAVGGLERCRRVLAMMIDPNTIAGTRTQHAWAQCVEAEAAARELVTKIRSAS